MMITRQQNIQMVIISIYRYINEFNDNNSRMTSLTHYYYRFPNENLKILLTEIS